MPRLVTVSDLPAWLGLKAMALAWLWVALAWRNSSLSHGCWLWLAQAQATAYY